MKTYNMKPMANHPYANAHVRIWDDDTVELVSYTTIIIVITPDGWLRCYGLYSPTTIRHIGWFMRERGFTYQLAKQMYLDHKEFNVYTGECRNRG